MNRSRGFTLLEILVAMAILALGVIAVIKLFPTALRQVRWANERTEVTQLASSRLGQLRAAGGDRLLGSGFELRELWTLDLLRQALSTYALYDNYSTAVDAIRGAHEVYLQRVTFAVQMSDGRHETFVTYVTKQ